jgi:molecular chaperone GrpE
MEENTKEQNNQQEDIVNNSAEEQAVPETPAAEELDPIQKLEAELAEMKDKYLRLYSEFENFRRRTSKEKVDLIKTAGEDVICSLLPTLDDFERALKAMNSDSEEVKPLREGIELVYHKTWKTLQAKGLVKIESIGNVFDVELHEAITQIPVQDEAMKGKVVDEVEAGYLLGEKVIRFSKVVIGA